MARRSGRINVDWETPQTPFHWEHVAIEVLMDVRNELQLLNRLLNCPNFTNMPRTLRTIDRRLARRYSLRSKK